MITDFPVPAAAVPGPGLAVTLVQLSGTLPPRGHWTPDQSMALQSTRQLGPGQVMVWQSCALHSPQLESAMRAAGHAPIPASVITSPAAVSGWAAFATPRSADDRDLVVSLDDADDGGTSSTTTALTTPHPPPTGH